MSCPPSPTPRWCSGLLNPDNFAGGGLKLDPASARRAVYAHIAQPLGMSVEAAAQGIHRVVNAQMAEGMRLVSIRQGFDPRDFTLVALGGAGPVHAIALAQELEMPAVIVPHSPGVLSAAGLLSAPIEHEVAAGFPWSLDRSELSAVQTVFEDLDRQCADLMAAEEVPTGAAEVHHLADVCYVGQSHYLEIELELTAKDALTRAYQSFIRTHEQVFGYSTESPARFVNLRSVHRASKPPAEARPPGEDAQAGRYDPGTSAGARAGRRHAVLDGDVAPIEVSIHTRSALVEGERIEGPAIIEQADTTTVIHFHWQAEVRKGGDLFITRTPS